VLETIDSRSRRLDIKKRSSSAGGLLDDRRRRLQLSGEPYLVVITKNFQAPTLVGDRRSRRSVARRVAIRFKPASLCHGGSNPEHREIDSQTAQAQWFS
jgi:hypothetical protein